MRGVPARNKRERKRRRGGKGRKKGARAKGKTGEGYVYISRDSRGYTTVKRNRRGSRDRVILARRQKGRPAPSLNFRGGTQRARYIIMRRSSGIRIPAAFQRYVRVVLSPETPWSPPSPLSYVRCTCVELAVDRSKSRVLKV